MKRFFLIFNALSFLSFAQIDPRDYSNCFDFNTDTYRTELSNLGFREVEISHYQVQWYKFGNSSYTKTVDAFRYENNHGEIAYATCLGIRRIPYEIGDAFFNHQLVFRDYRIVDVFGDDELVFDLQWGSEAPRRISLRRVNDNKWSNGRVNGLGGLEESIRLQTEGLGAPIAMGLKRGRTWDSLGALDLTNNFIRTIQVLDTWAAESIYFSTSDRLILQQGDSGLMRIINRSSFNVQMWGATPTVFFRPQDDQVWSVVGIPSNLIFSPYPNEEVHLKLRRINQGPDDLRF